MCVVREAPLQLGAIDKAIKIHDMLCGLKLIFNPNTSSTNGQEITQTSPSPPQPRQKVGLFHDLQRLTMSTRMRAFLKSCQVLQSEFAVDRQAEYQERWSVSATFINLSAIKIMHFIDVIPAAPGRYHSNVV